MHKVMLVTVTLLIAILLGACGTGTAPAPAPTPAPEPTPAPVPTTPEFEIKSLDIIPSEVTAEEPTKITAIVENTGGSDGTYAVILSVDGITAEVKETSLITPGSSTIVTFSLTKDTPGTYEISIGELSSSLTVVAAPAEFKVISLDIKPPEAVVGEIVSITAVVENTGGSDGTYTLILSVDGVTAEVKETSMMTPGSSEVVTFSLVKDAPGTYEVGIGESSSSLIVIGKEVELKYDDDRSDGALAFRGWGYLVRFLPPSTPFMITKVKIFGSLYGSGYENQTFDVQIWDNDLTEIHSASYPHTKFSLSPRWVEIDIPDVAIGGDFYIYINTYSPREGGINIAYDSSVTNEHSEVTQNWEIADWFLSTPKETVNWMIRVSGTATLPPD